MQVQKANLIKQAGLIPKLAMGFIREFTDNLRVYKH